MQTTSPTLGDVIRSFEDALRCERGTVMTSAQHAVLSALGRCRTAALGGHLYCCDKCGAEHPAYNSCRSRHCPSCLGHKSAAWLDERAKDLLPVPYFHVVFTLPDQVSALALGNKKLVYSILFRAASQTLLEIAADPKHLGATIGFLAILHTWTQKLLHHPHIHCVVPGGGLSPDQQWVSCREGFFLPVKVLSSLFRGKFLALLDRAAQNHLLSFAGSTSTLSSPRGWSTFIAAQRRKPWVVYAKPPFGSPEQVLKYLARYTHRVAISNRRILAVNETHVTFSYRDRRRDNVTRTMTLSGTEFLRRFLLHVLPKGFVRIRHFGLLANRVRRDRLATCRALLGLVAVSSPQPYTNEAPHHVTNDPAEPPEPRLCPYCRAGYLIQLHPIPASVRHLPHRQRAPPR